MKESGVVQQADASMALVRGQEMCSAHQAEEESLFHAGKASDGTLICQAHVANGSDAFQQACASMSHQTGLEGGQGMHRAHRQGERPSNLETGSDCTPPVHMAKEHHVSTLRQAALEHGQDLRRSHCPWEWPSHAEAGNDHTRHPHAAIESGTVQLAHDSMPHRAALKHGQETRSADHVGERPWHMEMEGGGSG